MLDFNILMLDCNILMLDCNGILLDYNGLMLDYNGLMLDHNGLMLDYYVLMSTIVFLLFKTLFTGCIDFRRLGDYSYRWIRWQSTRLGQTWMTVTAIWIRSVLIWSDYQKNYLNRVCIWRLLPSEHWIRCTHIIMTAQRLRHWSNIVQMLYKCFVFAGEWVYCAECVTIVCLTLGQSSFTYFPLI